MTLQEDVQFPPIGINMLCQPESSYSGLPPLKPDPLCIITPRSEKRSICILMQAPWTCKLACQPGIKLTSQIKFVYVCNFKFKSCTFSAFSFWHRRRLSRRLIEKPILLLLFLCSSVFVYLGLLHSMIQTIHQHHLLAFFFFYMTFITLKRVDT